MNRKLAALVVLHFTALACLAQTNDAKNAADGQEPVSDAVRAYWPSQVRVATSDFTKHLLIEGRSNTEGTFYSGPAKEWSLVSFVDKASGNVDHWITFKDAYEGTWRFWNSAATDSAETLKVVDTQRDSGSCSGSRGCTHYETVSVIVPSDLLLRAATRPVKIQFSGRSTQPFVITLDRYQAVYQMEASKFHGDKVRASSR